MTDLGLFNQSFFEEVVAIVLALVIYDYIADPLLDGLWNKMLRSYKRRKGILERQDIS